MKVYTAYWSLLFISLISSCILFIIVASENVKVDQKALKDEFQSNEEISVSSVSDSHYDIEKDVLVKTDENVNYDGGQKTSSEMTSEKIKNSPNIPREEKISVEKENDFSEEEMIISRNKLNSVSIKDNKKVNNKRDASKLEEVDKSKQTLSSSSSDEMVSEENTSDENIVPEASRKPTVITLVDKASEIIIESLEINASSDEDDINKAIKINLTKAEGILLENDQLQQQQHLGTGRQLSSAILNAENDVVSNNSEEEEVKESTSPPNLSSNEKGNVLEAPPTSTDTISITNKDVINEINEKNDTKPASEDIPITTKPPHQQIITEANISSNEENQIPVFSEWAQKQLEEAEKKLVRDTVNSSAQKRNITSGNKPQSLSKIRAKNYASPDCGAKIIASNSEAQNTGAVLTSTKDEYMLSPCTSRIWFVVELCEAIQAEKIDLANFELFSSSPKNFSVHVSNRFPTREWSNVGRFIADDHRNVQSFDLHPHLFGKFVRVDIHSHYNSEHFCPISLFRIYGTSEFEAFETENRSPSIIDDDDDIDDEFDNIIDGDDEHQKKINTGKQENNIFKSASDAVLSIVKKAAEVLVVKANNNKSDVEGSDGLAENDKSSSGTFSENRICQTLKRNFNCEKCDKALVTRVNFLLSCKYPELVDLLKVNLLAFHVISSQVCAKRFNLNVLNPFITDTSLDTVDSQVSSYPLLSTSLFEQIHFKRRRDGSYLFSRDNINVAVVDEKRNYVVNSFSTEYLGAFCHILAEGHESNKKTSSPYSEDGETPLNLTIDQKLDLVNVNEKIKEHPRSHENDDNKDFYKLSESEISEEKSDSQQKTLDKDDQNKLKSKTEDINQLVEKKISTEERDEILKQENLDEQQTKETTKSSPMVDTDINIFNIVENNGEDFEEKSSAEIANNKDVNSFDNNDKNEGGSSNENGLPVIPETIEKPIRDNVIDENLPSDSDDILLLTTPSPGSLVSSNSKESETDNSWETFDNLLQDSNTNENVNAQLASDTAFAGGQSVSQQKVHSESVFLRLSNRIKSLERNMSLSGQYLEELSRRYKKQVEELQHSFAKTLSTIEEQNRRSLEREQMLAIRNERLELNLEEITTKLNIWMGLSVIIMSIIILQLAISCYQFKMIKRRNREFCKIRNSSSKDSFNRSDEEHLSSNDLLQMQRRKSTEGVSGHSTPNQKFRRPSEEAMRIQGSYKDLLILDNEQSKEHQDNGEISDFFSEMITRKNYKQYQQQLQPRQRKISVFYNNSSSKDGVSKIPFYRQESVPADFLANINSSTNNNNKQFPLTVIHQDDTGSLILDEDYENYLPGSDLAYNEFMPDGPSGGGGAGAGGSNNVYEKTDEKNKSTGMNGNVAKSKNSNKKANKVRRLSSPGFLKSHFSKSNNSKKLAHGPTGWEWYRSKKSDTNSRDNSTSKTASSSSHYTDSLSGVAGVETGGNVGGKGGKNGGKHYQNKKNQLINSNSNKNSIKLNDIEGKSTLTSSIESSNSKLISVENNNKTTGSKTKALNNVVAVETKEKEMKNLEKPFIVTSSEDSLRTSTGTSATTGSLISND